MGRVLAVILAFLFLATSCGVPLSKSYSDQYAHLKEAKHLPSAPLEGEGPYVVFYVSAPHLDYQDARFFLRTMMKHPDDGSMRADVGHAWIYLKKGSEVYELGHTGELGVAKPKYLDGVFSKVANGEDDPISYLWEEMNDGYFQQGSGRHAPTFGARVDLDEAAYQKILECIKNYPKDSYGLTTYQCCTFVSQVASICCLETSSPFALEIPQAIKLDNKDVTLWKSEEYKSISFASPDLLEKDLIAWVKEGKAKKIQVKKNKKNFISNFKYNGYKRYQIFKKTI